MMIKKILASLTLVSVMAVSAAMFAAYEAHVINVTAHIENALTVDPDHIDFGTVFPQEYVEENLEIKLSQSFMDADRVDDVEYVIKQKMKPCPLDDSGAPVDTTCVPDTADATPPHGDTGWHYLDLCQFLSKVNNEDDGDETPNDYSHPSYFIDPTPADPISGDEFCDVSDKPDATGRLTKLGRDTVDTWIIDLKVPPVDGSVGQDWPTGCPTVPDNDKTYGCDLWIEVTEISPAS